MKAKTGTRMEGVPAMADYSRRRLMSCADSFRELAQSLEGDFCCESQDRESRLSAGGIWENRRILCENLNESAKVMSQAAAEAFCLRPMEERKRHTILQALKAEKISVAELYYIERPMERTGIALTLRTDKKGGVRFLEVADLLSVALNRRWSASVNSPYYVDGENRSFLLVEEPFFVTMTGAARAMKEGEPCSGDNYAYIEIERGQSALLLADGTGSGEKASQDSGRILDQMEKLLEAGFDLENAIGLVNSTAMARGEGQSLSTLDVCSLNLYDGVCEFRKAGAVASFIKRDFLVEQIDAPSLPLGVLPAARMEVVSCELMDGDYIIMMSDGVLDALGENDSEDTMKKVIAGIQELNPGEIAEKLLRFVLHSSGGQVADDMTILVLGLWERAR